MNTIKIHEQWSSFPTIAQILSDTVSSTFFVTDINIMLPNTGDYIVDNAPNSEAAAFARVIGDMKTEVHFRCQLVLGTRGVKVTSLS